MYFLVSQRLTQITPPAATSDQLWLHVEAAWSAVPQEHIQSLFESMPRRVAAADWNPGKHNVVSRTLLESPEVLLQGCGIDYKKHEMLDVDQGQANGLHSVDPTPRAARRRWAAEHRDWEQHDWSQVLFTDESLFSLECVTRRVLVWRDRGTRNNPAFVRERSQYRRAGWMVWGGISIGGRTDLHVIRNGTLTGRRYADEILRPHVIPYAGAIGDSFAFQDDNARPHRARLVENMLEAETIQRMELPACSPDLNPIEHVWDMLRRRIAARPRPPATVRDLEIALLEEWNSIPQSLIDNFIASMANRCAAVLAVRGDHTPY
ncbi:transposable element Tcb2 transposase [Trichonephila clavipes]|nr:transposable element Tcb2 transposase [Trichonephila clavipes]